VRHKYAVLIYVSVGISFSGPVRNGGMQYAGLPENIFLTGKSFAQPISFLKGLPHLLVKQKKSAQ
jgi:hypothetical protein